MAALTRRSVLATTKTVFLAGLAGVSALAPDKIQLRLSAPISETGQRAVALIGEFGPAVAGFAGFAIFEPN